MSKNKYRSQNVKSVNQEKLAELVKNKNIVFGHDSAKESLYGVFMEKESREVIKTINWSHPFETSRVLDLLLELPWSSLEVALESTGTYGDSFRYQLGLRGIRVFRVSTKHSHDGHDMYDNVPSSHDAKSSAVIADLHCWKKSSVWEQQEESRKTLRASVRIMDLHNDTYHRYLNKLESVLARHWPEALALFDLTTASLAALITEYGSPQAVSQQPDEAKKLLRKIGGHFLKDEKIDSLVSSANTTLGIPPNAEETVMIQQLASEIERCRKLVQKAKRKIKKLSKDHVEIQRMGTVVGVTTGAVIHSHVGDSRDYESAHAYVKAMGLNLKERSSGKHKGQLKITKRGSGMCRRYVYLATLRLIQNDFIVRRWYHKKIKRDGGLKMKAIVAVMRKLVKALWHVNQGTEFCSSMLFDPSRLTPLNKKELCFD